MSYAVPAAAAPFRQGGFFLRIVAACVDARRRQAENYLAPYLVQLGEDEARR